MKKKEVRLARSIIHKWSEIEVGQEYVIKTKLKTYGPYLVEEKNWPERSLTVSLHRPPRIRRETMKLFSVHLLLKSHQLRRAP